MAQPYDDMTQSYVDGNDLGGMLCEVFAVDVTVASGACAGCGRVSHIAETRVYDRAPGLVARCPGCASVVLRVVRGPDRLWLDLRGLTYLEMPMAEPATVIEPVV
jgi:hypothetical protein